MDVQPLIRLPVGLRELPEEHWQFLFPPRPSLPDLEVLSLEEVRPILALLATLEPRQYLRFHLLEEPGPQHTRRDEGTSGQSQVRSEFLSRFGPPPRPLPETLAWGRLLLALQHSPQYMGEGIREAAISLFSSPAFVLGVCLSIVVYFAAWLAPEPLFSKAFAATLTLRLSLAVGLVELSQVARAGLRLYHPEHNEAIERELASREAAGHTSLRKDRVQRDAAGRRVYDVAPQGGVRFRSPDASSVRPDGVRHNTNYVSNPQDLKRELEAFDAMKRADPDAIHELYSLDGTLVSRYVPPGVRVP